MALSRCVGFAALCLPWVMASMPDCSTAGCPKTCSCVEQKCGSSMYAECAADSQCQGIMSCLVKCGCGDIFCALGCVSGKTLDAVSAKAKTAASSCATSERTVIFDRKSIPQNWTKVSRAARPQKMSFLLALTQPESSTAKLEELFWQVSDPKSSKYQAFLSTDEVDAIVQTPKAHRDAVGAWLELEGVPKARVSFRSDAALVMADVETVERIFKTEVYIYVHSSGHTILRSFGQYSVPSVLDASIHIVEGIADFPMHRSPSRRHASGASQVTIVPESLASLYKFAEAPVPSKVIQMPAEFQDDASYSPSDLKSFFNQTALPDQKDTHRVGPFNDQYPDTEATLDTQYMLGVGLGASNYYWTSEGWMYTFANNLFNSADTPHVVSMSWGWAESSQCTIATECSTLGVDSKQYVARTNVEFMKLGVKGVSIFASSGDSGANGRSDGGCTGTKLNAVFPAGSPYLTAVGATMLTSDAKMNLNNAPPVCTSGTYAGTCASSGTEVAVSYSAAGFTSGGGFSDYIAQPSYQKAVVSAYLNSGVALPPASYFNAAGRGYPDVAAMGNNFLVYIQSEGGWSPVGGTSASSPTWAGIAARLVDISLQKTGKPLGPMNQLLYQMHAEHPAAFVDVTAGDNKCTEDGCASTCKGFEATKGWDPVTGLGVPQYDVMEQYVTSALDRAMERRAADSVVVV